ncbi:hypothetical protein [Dictyobacter aurantiacus]|uniref:Uncharacterized protein n=1 Tax=Dictyobacter aurantiacus TaxID=1936993 RepID=A0A401ZKL8_9CHLR|nr:hypothetical protein [Dictyobacter aurantiacus]GCE07393.1 hypothetical protein KDAU_47220 [Dictyobacter aurantiacus]
MTQTREHEAMPGAAARAELIASVAGGQLGTWVGLATRRLLQATQTLRDGASQMGASVTSETTKQASAGGQLPPTMERAEVLVERLGQWSQEAGVQTQKTLARLWEDTEDMYMEAQDMRARWKKL